MLGAGVDKVCAEVMNICSKICRMEKLSFRKTSDYARMFGTVICISGAVTMSVYKGMAIFKGRTIGEDELHGISEHGMPAFLDVKISHWSVGVLCLLANCTSWGLYLINQVPQNNRTRPQ